MSDFDVPKWEADTKTDAIIDSLFSSNTKLLLKKNEMVKKEVSRTRVKKAKIRKNKKQSVSPVGEDTVPGSEISLKDKKVNSISTPSDSVMFAKSTGKQMKNSKKKQKQNGTNGSTGIQTVETKQLKISEEKKQNQNNFGDHEKSLIEYSENLGANKKHKISKKNKYAHLGHQSKKVKLLHTSTNFSTEIPKSGDDICCEKSPMEFDKAQANDSINPKSVSRKRKLQGDDSETVVHHKKQKAIDPVYQFSNDDTSKKNGTLITKKNISTLESNSNPKNGVKKKIIKKTRKRMQTLTEHKMKCDSGKDSSSIVADESLSQETEIKSCDKNVSRTKYVPNDINVQNQICRKENLPKSPFNISRLRNILDAAKSKENQSNISYEKKLKTLKKHKNGNEQQSANRISEPVLDKLEMNERKFDSEQTLRDSMMKRLSEARFRFINEQLYTSTSTEAVSMFQTDSEAFTVYHEGFQSQVEKWPTVPVDRMIDFIKNRDSSLLVADFGCGDAKIAQSVPNKVHSFDLVALNEHVTACDMKHVPLAKKSVDIVVFCLSLMGTNLAEFLSEANRVLRQGGTLLIAEVISRFEKITTFVKKLEKFGFKLIKKDQSNTMFVWFEFNKVGEIAKNTKLPTIELEPCTYKKR